MKLKPVIISLNGLKKEVYKVLNKYHSLERRRKLTKAYSKKYKDEYYVVLVLKHITNVLQYAGEFVENPMGKIYIERLELFYSKVNIYATSNCSISREELVTILKSTTKIFNDLLEQKVKVKSNEMIHKEWTKCVRANTTIWGNN